MNFKSVFVNLALSFMTITTAEAATLSVGPGKQFATIRAAVIAAASGDTIEVQAGTYLNDFPPNLSKPLTIKGVNGRPHITSDEWAPNAKGVFVTSSNVSLINLEVSDTVVSNGDGANGAAVRFEGGNLIIDNCYFHHNQNGIMGNATGTVTVTNSEFALNGVTDDVEYSNGFGYTHNLYIRADKLTISHSYFFAANYGHNIKSRSPNNSISDNVIVDGAKGLGSYSIDLPNGGVAVIENNLIEKGPMASNPAIISFGAEGNLISPSTIRISGNIVLNDKSAVSSMLLNNYTTYSAIISDNSIFGLTSSQIVAKGPATISGTKMLASEPYSASSWSTMFPSPWPLSGSVVVVPPAPQPMACSFNGNSIASGASVLAYQSASVPYGSMCVSESRMCNNGVLSGSYTNATCSVQPAPPVTTGTFSLFDSAWVPSVLSANDSAAVELGMKFISSQAGYVKGVRFYKGTKNIGKHIGSLWDANGRRLAKVTFTNESVLGWQQAMFASPVKIAPNTTYVISYYAPRGNYSASNNYFAAAKSKGPLSAPAGAGVYRYGSSSTFPSSVYQNSNYWVDVVFEVKP